MSTIEVNKITPVSGGTAIQVGESGDTITIPSGATITNSGTATGFGVAGTNSFSVAGSGNQTSTADDTWTKLTFDSENWDTDSCFASNKFTAPAAGKYFFTANASMYGDTDNGNSISGKTISGGIFIIISLFFGIIGLYLNCSNIFLSNLLLYLSFLNFLIRVLLLRNAKLLLF